MRLFVTVLTRAAGRLRLSHVYLDSTGRAFVFVFQPIPTDEKIIISQSNGILQLAIVDLFAGRV
jgi:hypothetical protein